MRILAVMVTKNEVGRYLRSCLEHLTRFVDGIAIYDDRSIDFTAEVCKEFTPFVKVRNSDAPAFLDHEGKFRAQAWWWFEETLEPTTDDWVLCVDADEFLVGDTLDVRSELLKVIGSRGTEAVRMRFPEIFDVTVGLDGLLSAPQRRIDGWWGRIVGHRLFRYRPGGEFKNKAMACGAEPTYVDDVSMLGDRLHGLHMLHLGYALSEDRHRKYLRYASLPGHGHANTHVQSILQPSKLVPWTGPWPIIKVGG